MRGKRSFPFMKLKKPPVEGGFKWCKERIALYKAAKDYRPKCILASFCMHFPFDFF